MPPDYSGQNLRGRSFKNQDLVGENFSYADIRGANFSGANLKGVNFSHTQGGLQRRWVTLLALVSFLVSGFSGFFWAVNGYLVSLIFKSNLDSKIEGWTSLIILTAFFFIVIRNGLVAGAFAGSLLSTYIAWRALKGDEKYSLVRNIAVSLAAIGGTSFRGANLISADFTKARLKSNTRE
jgi:hypothetical protein